MLQASSPVLLFTGLQLLRRVASLALACAGYGVAFAVMGNSRGGRGLLEGIPLLIGWTSIMSHPRL